MKNEILNLAALTVITIVVIALVTVLYYFKMKNRITTRNQCPCCSQNYGQRVQTPFIYDALRTILSIPVKTYKCLSCNSIFFVK
jgi:hypothetical protein